MKTRRAALALIAAGLLLPSAIAEARIHGGGASSAPPPSGLTTITLANATGAGDTPMWSKMFGHPFKQGDIPAGTAPIFKIGGTVVPYSMSVNPTTWPDGSMMHAQFILLLGGIFTVPANGTLSCSISNGGTAPAASSRTTSDFTAADIKHTVTLMDGGSGTYTSSLNDGITNYLSSPENYVWLDGAAGKLWKIRADYKSGGVAEGTLTAYWYVLSGQNASGGFGGILVQGCMTMPWSDITPASKVFKSFSQSQLFSGASLLRDNVTARTNTQTISWSSGSTFNATGNVIEEGQLIRITSTGTLPTGIAANTSYWCDVLSTNTMAISQVSPFGSNVTATGAGTGTITATAYPYLPYYVRQFFCGTSAEYDFVQGGGSVSAVTVSRVQMSQTYWQSTGVIPAWDMTIPAPSSGASTAYYMNTCGPWANHLSTTGEDDFIGVFPSNYVRHLFTQAAVDELNVRVCGLVGGNLCVNVRDSTHGRIIPVNNGPGGSGSYTGLATPQPTARWEGANGSSGLFPATTNCIFSAFDAIDSSHRPAYAYYPYLFTGQPEYLEMIMEMANAAPLQQFTSGPPAVTSISTSQYAPVGTGAQGGSRNVTTSGVTRYGIFFNLCTEQRVTAWALRDLAAAYIAPASHAFFGPELTYLKDVANDNAAFVNAIIGLAPTAYAANNGLFFVGGHYFKDCWQEAYALQAASLMYGLSQNSNWLTFMNKTNVWWAHAINTIGAWSATAEEILSAVADSSGALISSDSYIAFAETSVTWTNGSANFPYIQNGSNVFTPTVGDIVFFTTPNPPSETTTPLPAAIAAIQTGGFQPFYVVSVTGTSPNFTLQISSTPGGSAIVNTDSSTHNTMVWYQPQNTPATGSQAGVGAATYITNLYRSMLLSSGFGATVDATAMAALAARQGANSQFVSQPKYAFAA